MICCGNNLSCGEMRLLKAGATHVAASCTHLYCQVQRLYSKSAIENIVMDTIALQKNV